LCAVLAALPGAAQEAGQRGEPLRVCATTPDLGSLVELLLAARAQVTVFAGGAEDPHFLDPRPSMVRTLHGADVLVEVGLDLEAGWLPVLRQGARNAAVQPGAAGHVDASTAVAKLGVPAAAVDRSMGDVHLGGNPHFLLDPVCGLQVAALLRDRLAALRPELAGALAAGFARLRRSLAEAMVGTEIAALYDHDAEKLALLFEHGKLQALLEEQGDAEKLGGWFALLKPWRGAVVLADHDLWPYFARRFGVRVLGFLEPKPGIPPTTRHLEALIARARTQRAQVVLSVPYLPERHARFVADALGGRVAAMAHQTGARPRCTDWVRTVDHNVRELVRALEAAQ
jgi:ABC-type Zn uptake system ZnuABC Zn-binding protein ZnuA